MINKKNIIKKLVIIGASGHGKVVASIAKTCNYQEIIFLDDDISKRNINHYPVVGTTDDIDKYLNEYDFVVAIGDNKIRKLIANQLERKGAKMPPLIHAKAIIDSNVIIGDGTVVMANVVINSNSKIGKHCILNTSSSIDHDNIIDDYVHISPGVHTAGNVHIGEKTWLGIGSTVINNINIESNIIIGAGSVVINNLDTEGVYIGIPAKERIKK